MSGYGKLTAGAFHTIAADGGRSYGVNGEDTKDSSGIKVNYDNNAFGARLRKETGTNSGTGGCDDSYMMVSMIPLADSAGTLSVQISSQAWHDDLSSPLNSYPSSLIEDRGQDYISDGATSGFLNRAILIGSLATISTLF